jgi:hypothetical protein
MCAHNGHAGVVRHVLEACLHGTLAALVANALHDICDAATFSLYALMHGRRMCTACVSSMIWVPGMSREAAGRRDGREISPLIVSHSVETCLVKIVLNCDQMRTCKIKISLVHFRAVGVQPGLSSIL